MSRRTVAYVTSEITPFAKTGGLADVSGALPAYLHRAGHDVRVFAPLYSAIDLERYAFEPIASATDVPIKAGNRTLSFSVHRANIPDTQVPVYFVHCPALYAREGLYTNDADEPLRFAFLSRAAIETCQRLGFGPDIFHCHDWQTSLVPLYLKTLYAWDRLFRSTRSILTIHNLGYQGVFPSKVVDELGLSSCTEYLHQEDFKKGRIGFLKTGLLHADWLTTVSPTYAREICTEQFGFGLHEFLEARRDTFTGILNGVDTAIWNPKTDPHIAFRYTTKSLWRKKRNKLALLSELGLPPGGDPPVFGMITRLVAQKGIALLEEPLPEVLERNDARLVVLGSGEARFERFFQGLMKRFPKKVHFHRGFLPELAHKIEAGADMFIMPSLYEPCGLNQMYSLIYGTVPIVRKTGGLADSVQLADPKDGTGTGIVFEHPTAKGVRWALDAALDLYTHPDVWKKIIANGMAMDFSWERQGRLYEELYERVRAPEKAGV